MNLKYTKKSGFTLTETMVAMGIFMILAAGTSLMIKNMFSNARQNQFSLENSDHARLVAFNFTNEIRSASVGVDGSYPITQASTTQIIFYSSYGNNSGSINKIRYFKSGEKLQKGVTVPSGSPLSYNSSTETITTVGTDIKNGNTPLFYYYNEDFNGTGSPLVQPVNLTDIRYVQINMIVLKQTAQNATTTFNIKTGASIRNLKTNLGN